ncbi:Rad52/Rad22 family DNA repair protein [Deinococcus altitudinis]|uniref:Rad52/Rad22 family DNA repair protein n=1 Tax=Deinococcus altitudinis TaxID=468914 RepID=UPI0038925E3F
MPREAAAPPIATAKVRPTPAPASTSGLSAAAVKKLRQPFGAEHLRWKIQTRVAEGQAEPMALVVVYVDARSVAAHLDDVVPGQWHSEYRAPAVTVGLPALECRLTVCGVTRCDVGTVEPGAKAGSDTKDLYSDALKRAAVQFGVGAFLYRFPQVQARAEKSGQTWYVTREAQAELRVLTRAVLEGRPTLPRFQALRVRGYMPDGVAEVAGAEPYRGEVTAPQEGPPPIGEERGHKMQELLTRSLLHSEWQGEAVTDYATFVLGFAVEALAELSETEARAVYSAAKLLAPGELQVSRAASD